jgi:hypothetical protein
VNVRNFWVGNRNLHTLVANNRRYLLTINLKGYTSDKDITQYYNDFYIEDESKNFKIASANRYGNNGARRGGDPLLTGDNTTQITGKYFSTYDRDNDGTNTRNCAKDYGAGWWFGTGCAKANVNGRMLLEADWSAGIWPQISWGSMTGFKEVRMVLEAKDPHPHWHLLLV